MTRIGDQVPPAVTLAQHDRPPWWDGHGQLVVALERLPQSAYVYDDTDPTIVYDDPDPDRLVYDAPFVGSGFTDVFCDMTSLEIVAGEPDQFDNYRAGALVLQLRDPGDGRYRSRSVDGKLLYWAVGRRVAVWWHDENGADWWLFSGRIARWVDPLLTSDVTIEAFSGLADLSVPMGRDWTAGAAGDYPQQRIGTTLTTAGYVGRPRRLDLGDVQLTVPIAADALPIDVIRRAATSDGGIVYSDADDTFVYRDRRWRAGRVDQVTVPVFTDNVCQLGPDAVVAWEVTGSDLDLRLAGTVRIGNDAGLTAGASNPGIDPTIVFTHVEPDLWTTQAEGNALAAYIASQRADARLAIGNAQIHLHDIRFNYWHQVLNLRIGDRIGFQHEDRFTDPDRVEFYDVTLIVTTMRHHVTAETWTVELGTTPAVAYTAVELYDWTQLVYDDPDPRAVYR